MSIDVKKYDEWFLKPFGAYADRMEKALIFEYLSDVKGKKILDLGCGTGNYSIELARRGAVVIGVDVSMEVLKIAREKTKAKGFAVDFIACKAEYIPIKKESFDMIVSVTACEFFRDIHLAVDEMKRIIKPGRKAVIGTINRISAYAAEKKISSLFNKESSYRDAKFFSIFEIRRLFDTIAWNTTIFALPWMPPEIIAVFEKADRILSKILKPFGAFLAIEAFFHKD